MRKFLTSLLLIILSTPVFAQALSDKLNELVNAYVTAGKFNGAVLVAQNGNILLRKGYGFSNTDTKQVNTPNSIFQIGSITKQFTSAIIMELQQEGKLSTQDMLSKYFPSLPNADKINIENLLTHTSGLYNYTNDTSFMKGNLTKHYSQQEMLSLFTKYPPDFEPGTKWNYSNTGYSILGYIIEKVTSEPYEAVVRKRIFEKLNMSHTGFDFTNLKDTDKTHGYFSIVEGKGFPAPIVDSTIAYSAGAIYTTVGDLYKWERSITNGSILRQPSWEKIFTPFKNKYGYGWNIDSLYGKPVTSHGGGIHGYSSYLLRFPKDDIVVIALDNSSNSIGKMANSLAAIVLNQPYQLPTINKEITLDTAILKQYVGEYQISPNFVINIMQSGNKLVAQATSQPAVDIFPKKENVFFLKVVEAELEFVKNTSGEVIELILHQGGRDLHGKKVK